MKFIYCSSNETNHSSLLEVEIVGGTKDNLHLNMFVHEKRF